MATETISQYSKKCIRAEKKISTGKTTEGGSNISVDLEIDRFVLPFYAASDQ